MKKLIKKLIASKCLLLFLIFILLCSCSHTYKPDYTYKWELDVVYTNGDTDTIECKQDSFKGNTVYSLIKWLKPCNFIAVTLVSKNILYKVLDFAKLKL